MSWSQWVSCLLSACLIVACRSAPRMQLLGETTRLPQHAPSPRESAVFDGQTVRLRGARGETLGLQLRLADGREREARLELPFEAARTSSFVVRSLEVTATSTSMYGPSAGPGVYPDVLVPSSGTGPVRCTRLAYFDVAIPSSAQPGRYSGSLQVDDRTVPVTLEVSSAAIDLSEDPLVWVFYLPVEIARAHGLQDDDGPALIEREAVYHQLFREHGAFLAADLRPARFEVRRRFVQNVKYWPVAVDISSDEAIAADVRSWLELFRDSNVTPFAIPVDEPRSLSEKQRARHIAEVIGRAGGGRPAFLRAVTDAQSAVYGDSMDLFFSPANIPAAAQVGQARGQRFWTYNGRPPAAGSMILDTDGIALRTWGWIAERYGVELWYAWEGLYFSDRYNRGGATDVLRDPITFDERSRGGSDFGNGDGLLAYPGPLPSLRLKALRRGLQDRLLLRKLAACGGAEKARRIVRRVVPQALGEASEKPSWSIEELGWESARYEVLDAIERDCHGQAAVAR